MGKSDRAFAVSSTNKNPSLIVLVETNIITFLGAYTHEHFIILAYATACGWKRKM